MKSKYLLYLILIISFLLQFSILNTETIIDTLYSIPNLDGSIAHSPELSHFGIGTDSPYGIAGDYYSNILWSYFFNRSFFAFELPIIPEGYVLTSSYINIYQLTSEGNDIVGNFPIFDMSSGTFEPPCLIEHLDYGYTLDETDFFLPSLNCIGIISNTPEVGWRTIDVTEFVLDDIENARPFTQYRLRLAFDTDNDPFMDALGFSTSDTSMEFKPFIIYIIEEDSHISNEQLLEKQVYLSSYPNPFNGSVTISYIASIEENDNMIIEIFNTKGQKIKEFTPSLCHPELVEGRGEVIWNAEDQTSGIYFIKISNSKQEYVKKITYLK